MIQMETTTTPISKELKDNIKRICEFARVSYSIEVGSIVDFKGTNIAFAKPHILKVNNNDYLIYHLNKVLKKLPKFIQNIVERLFNYSGLDLKYLSNNMIQKLNEKKKEDLKVSICLIKKKLK